jgi:hypothetical protein
MLFKHTSFTQSLHDAPVTAFTIFPVKANAKKPLIEHGFKGANSDPEQITRWTREFPGCNWGAPTGNSNGFVVLDLDAKHPESLDWWQEQQDIHGVVDTREVATPSGGSHLYFQAPEGVLLKSTASQIASGVDTRAEGGYIIIPPSSIDGTFYEVSNDVPIAQLPDWLIAIWPKVGERRERLDRSGNGHCPAEGSSLLTTPIPDKRRNVGLASVAGYLWNHCATVQELEEKLLEANERLCQPPLPEDEVLTIAGSISRYPQESSVPSDDLSWEEIQAAVAINPAAVDDMQWQQMAHGGAVEPYYMEGSVGSRRRFPRPTDRGHIDKLRNRQSEFWLEAQRRLGNVDEITRAHRCGGLYCNECDRGHVSAPEEKERFNCKQRLHPRCLGTNARKVFYFRKPRGSTKKTRGLTKIDDAGEMDIYIPYLGYFDMGEDPFYWPVNICRQLNHVRKHVKKLARRKGTPQGFKDSFVGLRLDLHQGYLTIDLVIAGGRDPALPQWLSEAFAEIATVPVTVETLHPRNPKKVIDQFGNLMSSAFTYSDVEECLAMLEALRGWRIVQPQGRFYNLSAPEEGQCSLVSIEDQGDPPIETSEHSTSTAGGVGSARIPCPECGDPTHSGGFRTGRWVKVLGDWSKQLTWLLLEDDADQGGGPGEGFEDFRRDVARAKEEQLSR